MVLGDFSMGQELRSKSRFELFLPISVSLLDGNTQIAAVTRDISSGGVYFYTEGNLRAGDAVEFAITLPAIVTQADDMPVVCRGRVVRVDSHRKEGLSGVAVRFETLTFTQAFEHSVTSVQSPAQA